MKNKHDKNKHLQELVTVAAKALKEAEDYAKEHGLEFSIYPAYGMGGTFYGSLEGDNEWVRADLYLDDTDKSAWYPSSRSC
jgi:hypothetical protein